MQLQSGKGERERERKDEEREGERQEGREGERARDTEGERWHIAPSSECVAKRLEENGSKAMPLTAFA